MKLHTYKELIVWQKSYALVIEIYNLTKLFPKEELFGLSSQIRRAVISIPSNIAEGYGRNSRKAYSQFCSIAYGSLLELETQLMLATDLGYVKENDTIQAKKLITEITKMLYVLIQKLNT